MLPYLLTSVLFLFLAVLGALDSSLSNFQILPWFNGLRWLRVHLITLGALAEAIFGVLPALASARMGYKKPGVRWDIWLALTAGLLILMVGIPLVNFALIVTGGTLIFAAAVLMGVALINHGPLQDRQKEQVGQGRGFYLAGLAFFLVGIMIGSGLWFGWGKALGIAIPIETHIHANIWGFMSLVFAGLAVDLYPTWTGRQLAWPGSVRAIFWLMTLGALGAVLGPWLGVRWLAALGIVLHQAATVWLLANLIKPLPGLAIVHKPGIWHLLTAYIWPVAVVLSAPLVVLLWPVFSAAGIEQTAPQVLIYGWMLQFGYAVLPYLVGKAVAPHQEAELGGSWFSLVAGHAGGVFLGASILTSSLSAPLLGTAYFLWFLSMLPIARQSWQRLKSGQEPPQEAADL